MSILLIRQALENRLAAITPSINTIWENQAAPIVVDQPHQRIYLLPARPDDAELGPGHIERGIFQVNLYYPLGKGTQVVTTRAIAVQTAFAKRTTLTKGGLKVNILETPEIVPGSRAEDDRFYMVPVRVRYSSYVGG